MLTQKAKTVIVEQLEYKAERAMDRAKSMLTHYLGLGMGRKLGADSVSEVRSICDDIFNAAVCQTRADIYKRMGGSGDAESR